MTTAIIGLCDGYFSKTKDNGITEHRVLLVTEGKDEYGRPTEITTGIKIGKRHLEQGMDKFYANLKGKQIAVPVFPSVWKSKAGNVGYDWFLADDGKPLNLVRATPVAAAS